MSHTTLEDVFLKLAKHSSNAETFKVDLEIVPPWQPGQPYEYVAKDGISYIIPASKMPDNKKFEKLKNSAQTNQQNVSVEMTLTKLFHAPELKKQLRKRARGE